MTVPRTTNQTPPDPLPAGSGTVDGTDGAGARGGIGLGRVLGVDVRLHPSWLVASALLTGTLADAYLPSAYPDWSPATYWIAGLLGTLLLLITALVHAVGHAATLAARGQPVRRLVLYVFGGTADPRSGTMPPGDELRVAVAGPLANLSLASLAWLLHPLASDDRTVGMASLLEYVAIVNLLVGLFNLLPGIPLDGGRALHALAWMTTGSRGQAACLADAAGRLVVVLCFALGIWQIASGNLLVGLWLSFVGSILLR